MNSGTVLKDSTYPIGKPVMQPFTPGPSSPNRRCQTNKSRSESKRKCSGLEL